MTKMNVSESEQQLNEILVKVNLLKLKQKNPNSRNQQLAQQLKRNEDIVNRWLDDYNKSGLIKFLIESHSETDTQKAVRTEQLWYAATMITINGLIISQIANLGQVLNRWFIVVSSVILSIYAIALILNRDYKYDNQQYRHPVYRNFFRNLCKAIKEVEGALFYILLVLASCIGAVFLAINN